MFSSQRTSAGSFGTFSAPPCALVPSGVTAIRNSPADAGAETAERGEPKANPAVLGLAETRGKVKAE